MSKMKDVALVSALALLFAASTASAEVRLSIQNGRVSLVAKDATVRQILAEWERIGQTKIVNLERIPGGPVTLELTDVSEQQALDVLLRAVSGYIVTPRTETVAANASRFDRVFVMPTSAAPRAVAAAPSPAFPQPQFQPPPTPDDDTDDDHPAPPVPAPVVPRGPVFNTFPQPQPGAVPMPGQPMQVMPGQPMQQVPATPQQGQPVQGPYPNAPTGGVAVPGMMVPAPAQPGQPGQFIVPGQPVPQPGQPRRPGGEPDGF